jgi:4-amino-4-deoxy-L-arabinose transferase-like glycosyltransferase
MESNDSSQLFSKSWLTIALLAILFISALGIRLYDLTDLPNDFYMVRQYHSLLVARGMYYAHLPAAPQWQRDVAAAQLKDEGMIEPPIMESLAALTYHIIGERVWVGRVFSSLFWLAGGFGIWLLAKELLMQEGGILALAYFLFLPFGMTASTAFMPDSLMTALIIWSLWALYRWEKRHTLKLAILAGILTGLAILVKSVAVFPLMGAAVGLVLSRGPLKRILVDKQTWVVVLITAIPTVIYFFYGLVITNSLGGQFGLRFFPALLKDPSFYGRWLFTAIGVTTFMATLLSVAGILLFRNKAMIFLIIGAWFGYIIFGFAFPYHFITHEYYHLPLIPIVAIGLIPVADLLVRQVASQKNWVPRVIFTGLLLFGVSMKMWEARNYMGSIDYRHEITYWQALGQKIGHDKNIIELSGDYGFRLAYFGWVSGAQWASNADVALRTLAGQTRSDFATIFAEMTSGKDLFLVTSPPEWENQPELREYLLANYPLVDQGDGYWIFDLRQ